MAVSRPVWKFLKIFVNRPMYRYVSPVAKLVETNVV
jgi:hypothetical protein